MSITAIETIKAYAFNERLRRSHPLAFRSAELIKGLAIDKDYSLSAIRHFARTGELDSLMSAFLARRSNLFSSVRSPRRFENAALRIQGRGTLGSGLKKYLGTHVENRKVDYCLSLNPDREQEENSGLNTFGFAFASDYTSYSLNAHAQQKLLQTPIAIIGYGASGILLTDALRRIGFQNLTVFERSKPLGIWSRENVYARSRNNPNSITFSGFDLDAAPGNGYEVRNFLLDVANLPQDNLEYAFEYGGYDSDNIIKRNVMGVVPRPLNHKLVFGSGKEKRFPIVINCMGLGKPTPLSDPTRMTTNATGTQVGHRWQQILNKSQVNNKRIVLIGLGNSTAEMLRQIHEFQDEGVNADYRVLTHYPLDSVMNPSHPIFHGGRMFRVFRDLAHNLVDYQGDLPESRYDYFRALNAGKIISGVKKWLIRENHIFVFDGNDKILDRFPFDQIFALTGYKHIAETFEKMGCAYDPSMSCAHFDYDGEFTIPRPIGRRILKGYFGFGSILETPYNPNAIVIPGMLHRLGDLVFSIIMRAQEYVEK